jgi:hypothetical protein
MPAEPIPLSALALDLPTPVDGWAAELDRRGVAVLEDDLGRRSISRADAAALFVAHRQQQEAAARHRVELEERLVAADEARRAAMPQGIPVNEVPVGVSAGLAMMLSDPFPAKRRQSVLEHSLEHPAGALIYTPINDGES